MNNFYNCKSQKRLSELLNLNYPTQYKKFINLVDYTPEKFYKRIKLKQNGKTREVLMCKPHMKFIHSRLQKEFLKDNFPFYLKSGIKKQSYLTNALQHKNSNSFLMFDIQSFFPSIKKEYIKKALILNFSMSSSVAEVISNIITYTQDKNRFLITGSPISQLFAYIVNKNMFEQIQKISLENNIKFTLYVDDLTFSSFSTIPYVFFKKIFAIINAYGYKVKLKKIYYGKKGYHCSITGVKLNKYGIFLTNQRKDKIRAKKKSILAKKKSGECALKEQYSLLSSLNQAIYLNKKYIKYIHLLEKHSILCTNCNK